MLQRIATQSGIVLQHADIAGCSVLQHAALRLQYAVMSSGTAEILSGYSDGTLVVLS